MNLRTSDRVALGALALVVLGTLLVYPALPESIPTHLDLRGHADGWSPRALGAWVLPLVSVGTFALVRLRAPSAAAGWTATLTIAFLGALQAILLTMALRGEAQAGVGLPLVLGSFDVVLGLLLPRVRRNRWVGIRLPWTLASDENWARTHHLGGRLFVGAGLLTLFACAASATVGTVVAFASMIATTIVLSVFSAQMKLSHTP